MKQSQFSGCRSKSGGTVAVTDQATLLLDQVTINESHSSEKGGALSVSYNSDLSARNTTLTDSRSGYGGGLSCTARSRMYLDSVSISSCSSSGWPGCVATIWCNVTMDNITITDVSEAYAIQALRSIINIYNTLAQNDTEQFLSAYFSHVSFWNFNMSGTRITLDQSVAEFRHTLFIRQDETCLIESRDLFDDRSTINLKSVYVTGPKNGIVCDALGDQPDTVVHGNVSGWTFTNMVFNGYEYSCPSGLKTHERL